MGDSRPVNDLGVESCAETSLRGEVSGFAFAFDRPCDEQGTPQQGRFVASGETRCLFDLARNGSRHALGEVLETCRNYLLMVANRELGENLQAKIGASDVVQETFVQAQQVFDRFQGTSDGELLAWLVRILEHKLAQTRTRFAGTQMRDVGREIPLDGGAPSGPFVVHVAAVDASPSSIVARAEETQRLTAALGRLPVDQQRAIELRNFERRSFGELAIELHRSEDAARKLWLRAVARLQRELNPNGDALKAPDDSDEQRLAQVE